MHVVVSQRQKKKKAEKQEINLLQTATFVGKFESMHGLVPLAQPCFKGTLKRRQIDKQTGSESMSIHSMLDLKLANYEQNTKDLLLKTFSLSTKLRSI